MNDLSGVGGRNRPDYASPHNNRRLGAAEEGTPWARN
jgi:hypothetical protein